MTAVAALRRETFKTSRLAEFCSRRELVNQTGHDVSEWPIVVLKELVDNALDAAEEAGVAPVIDIVVDEHGAACQTVREFITEFRGLSGTAKASAICGKIGATRQSLAEFYDGDGANVGCLLDAMKDMSRPPKPKELGVIGSDHLLTRFREEGAAEESLVYKLLEFEVDGAPYMVEAAFGMRVAEKADRRIITGLNFSASVGANPFRNLGARWAGLDSVLAEQRCGPSEPIVFFLHVTSPRLQFTDRGKSAIVLPSKVSCDVVKAVASVTARWTKQRKAEERAASARSRRFDAMLREQIITIKDAAAEVLPDAYAKASAGGTLPANARQIYYASRPDILELTGKDTLDSKYFTQTILVDYIAEHELDWDVVFDDRGHFSEPHTKRSIGLGTLAVRNYLRNTREARHEEAAFGSASISTSGPHRRYGAILFIEKEGFLPLLDAVKLGERYDLAIMSSKGMSVTAARLLADTICAKHDIPLLTLHDFDRAGFSIGETVGASNRRYTFKNAIRVVNLGLRLDDVEHMDLEFEKAPLGDIDRRAVRERLRTNGATEREIGVLVDEQRRVELNAMTSDVFIKFVETKLDEAGVKKVMPNADEVADAYRLFARSEMVQQVVDKALEDFTPDAIDVPDDLGARLREYLDEHPATPWDEALAAIATKGTP